MDDLIIPASPTTTKTKRTVKEKLKRHRKKLRLHFNSESKQPGPPDNIEQEKLIESINIKVTDELSEPEKSVEWDGNNPEPVSMPSQSTANMNFYSLLGLDESEDKSFYIRRKDLFSDKQFFPTLNCPPISVNGLKQTGGFQVVDDMVRLGQPKITKPPNPPIQIDTQLFISESQLNNLYKVADQAVEKISKGNLSSSNVPTSPNTVHEEILRDFDVYTPSTPIKKYSSDESPVWRMKRTKLVPQTYCNRPKIRKLNDEIVIYSDSSHDDIDSDSDLGDFMPVKEENIDADRFNLNISGKIAKNIMELSLHFSQHFPRPAVQFSDDEEPFEGFDGSLGDPKELSDIKSVTMANPLCYFDDVDDEILFEHKESVSPNEQSDFSVISGNYDRLFRNFYLSIQRKCKTSRIFHDPIDLKEYKNIPSDYELKLSEAWFDQTRIIPKNEFHANPDSSTKLVDDSLSLHRNSKPKGSGNQIIKPKLGLANLFCDILTEFPLNNHPNNKVQSKNYKFPSNIDPLEGTSYHNWNKQLSGTQQASTVIKKPTEIFDDILLDFNEEDCSKFNGFSEFDIDDDLEIKISDQEIEQAVKLFDKFNDKEFVPNLSQQPGTLFGIGEPNLNEFCGFKTGNGLAIKVSDRAKEQAWKLYEECNKGIFPTISSSQSPSNQGKTLPNLKEIHGNRISIDLKNDISDGTIERSVKTDRNFDNANQNQSTSKSEINPQYKLPKLHECSGFKTSAGLEIKVSAKAMKCAAKIYENVDDEIDPVPDIPLAKSTPLLNKFDNKLDTIFSLPSPVTSTPVTAVTSSRKRRLSFPSPTLSQEISATTNAFLEDESCLSNLNTTFVTSISAKQGLESFVNEQSECIHLEIPENIKEQRRLKFADQTRRIAEKNIVKPCPGTLYIRKSIGVKQCWRDFFPNTSPSRYTIDELTEFGLKSNVIHLTIDNFKHFKFNMIDFCDKTTCLENINGIQMSDGITLLFNESSQVGLDELKNAFLDCPSVTRQLLPTGWLDNALKLIFIKLSGMERLFPAVFGGKVMTPESVLLQLKWRYDREIDKAERSPLQKIVERDDTPMKRMCLFVSNICDNGNVELCDGWYCVPTEIDSVIKLAIKHKRIVVGTKLMVHGAHLNGSDNGHSPLELPADVKLKINGNSTRRVKWDTKLGFYSRPGPMLFHMNSIDCNGGQIGWLRVHILRVYPMIYLTKSAEPHSKSNVRSRRVENRYVLEKEKKLNTLQDELRADIIREIEEQSNSFRETYKNVSKIDISKIYDAQTLWHIVENGATDYGELNSAQKSLLIEYRSNRNERQMAEINERIAEKMCSLQKEEKSIPLLKCKITDLYNHRLKNRIALLSIWHPDTDLLGLLQEKMCIDIYNSSANGIRGDELQLTAGKSTTFKPLSCPAQDSCEISHLDRKLYSLEEVNARNFSPTFKELDTIGWILLITRNDYKKSESVYLADDKRNFVCVNFWQSLQSYAYDDLIKERTLLSFSNLEWRAVSKSNVIPCTFATEFTICSAKPNSFQSQVALNNLKIDLNRFDLEKYATECIQLIKEKRQGPLNTSSTITENWVTPNRPSIQRRIECLSIGSPPKISPLTCNQNRSTKRIRRDFKPPRRIVDS